jgi:5-(carboxyamino)imidazole ribonucleotide synthase
VQVCQDRAEEKRCFQRAGVPCAPFRVIDKITDCDDALPAQQAAEAAGAAPPGAAQHTPLADLLPGILKTARMGYDGKGQRSVDSAAELAAAWVELGRVRCVLEKRLPLAAEISVILARGADGHTVHLPPQHNLHRHGILAVTQVPAPGIAEATLQQAVAMAGGLAQALQYVGVLCVEFFVLADGTLVANEMAPRPHNSGHYSIDACDVSQFDLQLRTLAGLPLVQPRLHSAAVMLNLLGDLWLVGAGSEAAHPQLRAPDWAAVLALPGTRLHLYGKAEPRIGRKMGHLTVTAPQLGQAQQVAREAAQRLGLPAF